MVTAQCLAKTTTITTIFLISFSTIAVGLMISGGVLIAINNTPEKREMYNTGIVLLIVGGAVEGVALIFTIINLCAVQKHKKLVNSQA